MKIFSLAGLIVFLVYYVVIDQVLTYFQIEAYSSPFTAGVTAWSGKGKIDTKATVIGSFAVLAGALVLVYFTPRLF